MTDAEYNKLCRKLDELKIMLRALDDVLRGKDGEAGVVAKVIALQREIDIINVRLDRHSTDINSIKGVPAKVLWFFGTLIAGNGVLSLLALLQ